MLANEKEIIFQSCLYINPKKQINIEVNKIVNNLSSQYSVHIVKGSGPSTCMYIWNVSTYRFYMKIY